jgi:hypothetical protein
VLRKNFVYNFICFLFIVMVIFGHLIWLAEHQHNSKQFDRSYLHGIHDGIWWAMVTVTMVGYGDLAPLTPVGRIIAMLYMMIGLSLFSILSGFIASEFVAARESTGGFNAVRDLAGHRVCGYPPHVLNSALLSGVAFTHVAGEVIEECGTMLQNEQVDAIVWDMPVLLYWRAHNAWAVRTNLRTSDPLNDQLVSLLVAEGGFGTPELGAINSELIDFRSSSDFDAIHAKWQMRRDGTARQRPRSASASPPAGASQARRWLRAAAAETRRGF